MDPEMRTAVGYSTMRQYAFGVNINFLNLLKKNDFMMKNKIKIFRKLVRCIYCLAVFLYGWMRCGLFRYYSTNNISGSSIWTKATLAEQAVIGVYNVFLDQYCPNSGILIRTRIPWDAYSSVMDTDKNWIKRMPNCTGAATPSSGLFSDIYKRFILLSIVLMM